MRIINASFEFSLLSKIVDADLKYAMMNTLHVQLNDSLHIRLSSCQYIENIGRTVAVAGGLSLQTSAHNAVAV